jgi:hypothetical protein
LIDATVYLRSRTAVKKTDILRNNIILRDLPKKMVQIDLWPFEIHGGFRGFQMVPSGLHYIAVLHDASYRGSWDFLQNEALVKVFDHHTSSLVGADDATQAAFRQMADRGAMSQVLIQYPELAVAQWHQLTSHITPENFSAIHTIKATDIQLTTSRDDLIASYQWAFLKVVVVYPENLDVADMQDWVAWVQGVCSADSAFISKNISFCNAFMDLLPLHLNLLPAAYQPVVDSLKIGAMELSDKIKKIIQIS